MDSYWQSRGDEFESRMLHKEISGKPRIITYVIFRDLFVYNNTSK